jgi:hypothetical protein
MSGRRLPRRDRQAEFRTGKRTGNGLPFSTVKPFRIVTIEHVLARVEAAADGSLWLMAGTHSGFEAFSALYYTKLEATLTPVD